MIIKLRISSWPRRPFHRSRLSRRPYNRRKNAQRHARVSTSRLVTHCSEKRTLCPSKAARGVLQQEENGLLPLPHCSVLGPSRRSPIKLCPQRMVAPAVHRIRDSPVGNRTKTRQTGSTVSRWTWRAKTGNLIGHREGGLITLRTSDIPPLQRNVCLAEVGP